MIDSLRQVLLIIEHGTFTAAARQAHLSQPALSASIQRLEQDLGARLFHRGRQGAELTAAGAALLPHARAVLAGVQDARRAVAQIAGLETGRVRLGAGATYCTYVLPPLLLDFRRRFPGLQLRLREAHDHTLRQAIAAGDLDLAVVPGPGGEPWRIDELILVGRPGSRLQGSAFVTFAKPSPTRAWLDRLFPDAEIAMELASIAAVKGNVREGIGLALVSRSAVKRDLADGRLIVIPHQATPVRRQMVLLHRGLDRLSPAAQALREALIEG
jgi:DNA-binding transcriptional LysR family regulator